MKKLKGIIIYWLTLLTGLALIFIGGRFLLAPESAETAYGINLSTNGDHSFHYIKGVRDLFTGTIITLFLLLKQYRGLGLILLTGTIIPASDFVIVLSHPGYDIAKLYPHISAVIICMVSGIYYLSITRQKSL